MVIALIGDSGKGSGQKEDIFCTASLALSFCSAMSCPDVCPSCE